MKLEEEINQYGELKSAADSYKKQAEAENAVIKKYMLENNLTSAKSDSYSVSCKTITSQSFNDEKLLEKLKSLKTEGIVKTREYVDMEALEGAIYNGKLNASELADCRETKQQVRLTIKAN